MGLKPPGELPRYQSVHATCKLRSGRIKNPCGWGEQSRQRLQIASASPSLPLCKPNTPWWRQQFFHALVKGGTSPSTQLARLASMEKATLNTELSHPTLENWNEDAAFYTTLERNRPKRLSLCLLALLSTILCSLKPNPSIHSLCPSWLVRCTKPASSTRVIRSITLLGNCSVHHVAIGPPAAQTVGGKVFRAFL
jgi:hypothetical protein